MNKVTFTAPYPVSVNRLWMPVRSRLVLTPEARAYKERLGLIALEVSRRVYFPNDQLLSLELILYRPSKRGDADNFSKITLDSMKGILFHDDEQFIETHTFRRDDPANPRVVITIEHIETRPLKKTRSSKKVTA